MIPFLEQRDDTLRMFEFSNMHFPAHLHRHAEWVWIYTGVLNISISGVNYALAKDDMALVFPNVIHSYSFDSACTGLMTIFDPETIGEYSTVLLQRLPTMPIVHLPFSPEGDDVRYCLRRLFREYGSSFDEPVCRAYVHLALARTMPMLELRPRTNSAPGLLYRAIDYIAENYSQPLTLDSVAEALDVSRHHLSHMFSQKLGMSFRGYLNELRIAQAQRMLRETAATITDICYSCGFETVRTFNRAFAALTLQTPTEYRHRTT